MNILSKVSALKGIGEKREQLFNAKGIYTVLDLLFYLPKSFKDFSRVRNITDDVQTESLYYIKVASKPGFGYGKNRSRFIRFKITDKSGDAFVYYFNMAYMAGQISKDENMYLFGKMNVKDNKRYIVNPNIIRTIDDKRKFVPVYPVIHGIGQNTIMKCIELALNNIKDSADYLTDEFKSELGLPDFYEAHKNNHFPDNLGDRKQSNYRFAMEELLVFLCLIENYSGKKSRMDMNIAFDDNIDEGFKQKIGFEPTCAQTKAMMDIRADFESEYAMNRLVQGDVGCGKTVVAFYAMYLAFKAGHQSMMMAPTEVLARQHYENAVKMFGGVGIELVTGSMTKAERKQAKERLEKGQSSMVFGTHALLFSEIEYKSLVLAITDEQHRFGVSQRAKVAYGGNLNTLVMSATPIPRTLALVLYSNIDVSIIDEMPHGRQETETFIVGETKRKDMYDFIKKECEKGFQAYVVCPLIDSEENDKSVYNIYEQVKGEFGIENIEVLHGKMSNADKNDIMMRFKSGEIDVLISTTVIEVGVDVRNATIIAIEQAHIFGMSTLHQLRGRVGRGSDKAYCFLVSDVKNDRLEAVKQQSDGFKLAEMDLELRGPGQFLGKKQHGIDDFYMHRIINDTKMIGLAKDVYQRMKDGEFAHEYSIVKANAQRKYKRLMQDIALN